MKVSIAAKRVVILLMTMALAVALVACSGAAGTPGPAGPAGDQGPPGKDALTPDPTDPTDPQPGDSPVAAITTAHTFRFNDAADGTFNKEPMMVNVAPFFHPGSGLMYTEDASADMKKIFDVQLSEDGMLTVTPMKADAAYMNHMFKVKAASPNGTSDMSAISVRRNQPPMAVSTVDAQGSGDRHIIDIWVTDEATEIESREVADAERINDNTAGAPEGMYIYTAIGDVDYLDTRSDHAFFSDDPGNTLHFTPVAMSPGQRQTLMVSPGVGKITLKGLKTTLNDDGDADEVIPLKLSASDDGGLEQTASAATIFEVSVDTAPTIVKNIGNQSHKLASGDANSISVTTDVSAFFDDDRADATDGTLVYKIKSSDPTVAIVKGTEGKADFEDLIDGDANNLVELVIEVKSRGTVVITVRAIEPPVADGATAGVGHGADGERSVEQMFTVEVN